MPVTWMRDLVASSIVNVLRCDSSSIVSDSLSPATPRIRDVGGHLPADPIDV